jgi:hypothetical protein
MSGVARWCAAVLVTVAAFGCAVWVSGAVLLPAVMTSGADRWVVAAGLGVAVAALAALGVHSWATREGETWPGGGGQASGSAAGAGRGGPGERSITAGGDITGIANSGDDAANTQQR